MSKKESVSKSGQPQFFWSGLTANRTTSLDSVIGLPNTNFQSADKSKADFGHGIWNRRFVTINVDKSVSINTQVLQIRSSVVGHESSP
jgi:hypothetical protein